MSEPNKELDTQARKDLEDYWPKDIIPGFLRLLDIWAESRGVTMRDKDGFCYPRCEERFRAESESTAECVACGKSTPLPEPA